MIRCSLPLVILLYAATVEAHKYELGINIEPRFGLLGAVAPQAQQTTLAPSLGGVLGLEFYPLNMLSIVLNVGYMHGLADSLIGEATFSNRTGLYYFSQSTGLATAGLRLETLPSWMPLILSVSAQAGAALLVHTNRDLRNKEQLSYKLDLATDFRVLPMLTVDIGIGGRITNQIRLSAHPALYVFFAERAVPGAGIHLALTFFFYP